MHSAMHLDDIRTDQPFFAPSNPAVEPLPGGGCVYRSAEPLQEYAPRIVDHLLAWARQAPDRRFLCERAGEGWRHVTYSEAAERVRRIAAALLVRRLGPERPIAILSGNAVDHGLLSLAAQLVGIPVAPVSPNYSLASADLGKLRHVLRLLRPGLIYVATSAPFTRALAVEEAAEAEILASDPTGFDRALPFATLLGPSAGDAVDHAAAAVDPDLPAKILFTSGSTGVPKGVITTHRMIAANQQQLRQVWRFLVEEPPVLLDWMPWHHVFGGNCNFNMALRNGGTLWIDDGRPVHGTDFERTIRNLREVSPTIYFSVPRSYELLAPRLQAEPEPARRFFAHLRILGYGAASLPPSLWRALEDLGRAFAPGRRAPPMISSWGLTETTTVATAAHWLGAPPGCIGAPLPGLELKLTPVEGKLEARVRGPNVSPGYWRDPDKTAAAFDAEGFFATGDALRWVDPAIPAAGLAFDGRTAEDFKLSSGTRVHAGEARARALEALSAVARDVVVTGHDRAEVGLLIFLRDERRGDDLGQEVRTALVALNAAAGGGSSRTITRAILLTDPPSPDAGEVTDKGSLNARTILARRATDVTRLYNDADVDAAVIRP